MRSPASRHAGLSTPRKTNSLKRLQRKGPIQTDRPFAICRRKRRNSVGCGCQLVGKNRLKAALLVLIVKKNDGSEMQRLLAVPAGRQLSLQILQETIGEVILGPRATRRFRALLSTLRTHKFNNVLLRIAVERSPAGVTNPYSFQ